MLKIFYSIKVSVTVAVSKIWTNIDFSMITASNVNINNSFGILKSRAFWYMCFWSDQQPFLIILREKAKHNLTKESAFRMELDLKTQASFKLTFVSLHLIKFSCQWEFKIALDLRIPKLSLMLTFHALIMEKTTVCTDFADHHCNWDLDWVKIFKHEFSILFLKLLQWNSNH